ncbi:MAG: DeoR/GlpR transcriptional regulator [Spirochaetales bacterium]|jgi:DeoR family transcriptional regulator, fructose operon transcriptional repressor|nr:DeoR/GlpR transcriptional regulator [Spirochaetales bacterium]
MSKFDTRKTAVFNILTLKKELSVQEASDLLGTSPATTRRFFERFAAEGQVVRMHGGIKLVPESKGTYSYILSNTRRIEQKAVIAERAATMVESGDLLFLDSGTTLLKMAEALDKRLQADSLEGIVVVTNSLVSYEKLSENCRVILVGGEVRLNRRDTYGQVAENALKSLHLHKSFFGADAIHPQRGLMATDEWTCRMNDIVRINSDSVIVLSDSEKFGRSSLLSYGPLDSVDLIITDEGITEEELSPYRSTGAKIEIVSEERSN